MNIGIFERYRVAIISIPFLWVGVFVIIACIFLFAISISSPEFAVIPYNLFFKIQNGILEIKPDFSSYKLLFADSFYLKALCNSLSLASFSTFFTFLIAYPMAYKISRAEPKARLFLLILTIAPFWTALLIRVYGWIIILKNNGLLNQILISLNIINEPLVILNTKVAVVIGIIYTYLPFMVLPIYSSLLKIKENILEAASDLGAKPFSIFWQVTFPLSFPGVIIGMILVFIPAVGEFVIPELLGGAKIITIGKLLWTEFFMNRDWPMASAITIIIVFMVILPIKLIHRFTNNNF